MYQFKEVTPGRNTKVEIPAIVLDAMKKRGIHNLNQLAIACGWTKKGRMKTRRMFTKSHAYLLAYARMAQRFNWTLSDFCRVVVKTTRSRAEEKLRARAVELYGSFSGLGNLARLMYQFFDGETDFQPLRDYQLISDVIGLDIDSLASALVGFDIGCKDLTTAEQSVTLTSVVAKHVNLY